MSSVVTLVAEIEDRVARGSTYLDKKRPGWEDDINLDRLELCDGRQCILGQLYGSYIDAAIQLGITHQSRDLGFLCQHVDGDVLKLELVANAWKRLINNRRLVATPA